MKLYIICILREKNFKSKQNNMSLFTLFKILNLKNSQIWIVSNRYLSIKCIMYYFINIYDACFILWGFHIEQFLEWNAVQNIFFCLIHEIPK